MHGNLTAIERAGNGTDQTVLTGSETRAYLFVQNKSPTQPMYIAFGISTVTSSIKIGPGGALEFFARDFMPLGTLYVNATNTEPYTVWYC